jgi:hypothetical protein
MRRGGGWRSYRDDYQNPHASHQNPHQPRVKVPTLNIAKSAMFRMRHAQPFPLTRPPTPHSLLRNPFGHDSEPIHSELSYTRVKGGKVLLKASCAHVC